MATLPDVQAGSAAPAPAPALGTAGYEPPNWRQVGMAGQLVSQGGQQLEQAASIVQQTNQAQDEVFVKAAGNALATQHMSMEFDPKSGYRNMHGANVASPTFEKNLNDQWNSAVQLQRDQLTNDNQKRLFDQQADIQGLQFKSRMLAYKSGETEKFNDQTDDDHIKLSIQQAAQHPTASPSDEMAFQKSLLDINNTLEGMARRKGLVSDDGTSPILDEMKTRAMTAAYSARITALNDGLPGVLPADPKAAQAMFDQVQDKLLPDVRQHLGNMITQSVKTNDESNTAVLAGHEAANNYGLNEKGANDFLWQKFMSTPGKENAKVYELAQREYEARLSKTYQGMARDDENAGGNLTMMVQQGATWANVTNSKWYEQLGQSNIAGSPHAAKTLAAVKDYYDATHAVAADKPVKTDPRAYYNITTHFGDGSSLDVTKLPPTQFMGLSKVLSPGDFKTLTDTVAESKNGKGDPGSVNMPLFNSGFNSSTAGWAKKTPEDQAFIGGAKLFAQQKILDAQNASGHKFNQDEINATLSDLFTRNVEFRKSYLGGAFHTDAGSQPLMQMRYEDLPEAASAGLMKSLFPGVASPNAVQKQRVLDAYRRSHSQ